MSPEQWMLLMIGVAGYLLFGEFLYGLLDLDDDNRDFGNEVFFICLWPLLLVVAAGFIIAMALSKVCGAPFRYVKKIGKKTSNLFKRKKGLREFAEDEEDDEEKEK